jgi:flagellin
MGPTSLLKLRPAELPGGPTDGFSNRLEVGIPDLSAAGAALNLTSLSVSDQGSARTAVTAIDQAVTAVASIRGDIGAIQNRLDFSIGFTESEIENTKASESTIRDADVALEVSEFSRSQILLQASNAMLVQSNVASIGALALL